MIHVMDSGRVVESSTHAESVAVVRLLRRVVATADAGGGRHGHVSFALAPGEFVAILGPQWLR
ncbi:MAG: hypothetical protein IAE81_17530 [Caldilineaceae bacterium]|nr:hypothetical protein [Caldilineaceae bacterium]